MDTDRKVGLVVKLVRRLGYSLVDMQSGVYPFSCPRSTNRLVSCDKSNVGESVLQQCVCVYESSYASTDDTNWLIQHTVRTHEVRS